MDREKIKQWIDTAIEVAHEICGSSMGCCSSTITIPFDVALLLVENKIFDRGDDGMFYYSTAAGTVFVKTSNPKIHTSKMTIKVTK